LAKRLDQQPAYRPIAVDGFAALHALQGLKHGTGLFGKLALLAFSDQELTGRGESVGFEDFANIVEEIGLQTV
jgi:hypothetical protein